MTARTVKHHELCLKEMFQEHYQLTSSGDENREWTSNLCDITMEKFRVHLSWVMGLNTFEWDPQNIGNQILQTLEVYGGQSRGASIGTPLGLQDSYKTMMELLLKE